MLFELLAETDPSLRQPVGILDFSNLPEDVNLKALSKDMLGFLSEWKGIGLAAPQIGLRLRLFVMTTVFEQLVCINPRIVSSSEEVIFEREKCLSFPNLILNVSRPKEIFAEFQLVDGSKISRQFNGIDARCFLHELDHLDGITFDTRASKLGFKLAMQRRQKALRRKGRLSK